MTLPDKIPLYINEDQKPYIESKIAESKGELSVSKIIRNCIYRCMRLDEHAPQTTEPAK